MFVTPSVSSRSLCRLLHSFLTKGCQLLLRLVVSLRLDLALLFKLLHSLLVLPANLQYPKIRMMQFPHFIAFKWHSNSIHVAVRRLLLLPSMISQA